MLTIIKMDINGFLNVASYINMILINYKYVKFTYVAQFVYHIIFLLNSNIVDSLLGFLGGSVVKNLPAMKETWRGRFPLWVRKILWKRKWQPTQVVLSGKSHGQRSLVGYGPQGCKRVRHDWVTKQHQQVVSYRAEIHRQDNDFSKAVHVLNPRNSDYGKGILKMLVMLRILITLDYQGDPNIIMWVHKRKKTEVLVDWLVCRD